MAKSTTQSKHEIAQAAEDAVKVISTAAAEALKVSSLKSSEDHDLLIRIATQVEQVIKDVGDLKTNTTGRIDQLEVNCINKTDHEKVVNDIDMLKSWRSYMLGAIAIIGIVVPFIITYEMSK